MPLPPVSVPEKLTVRAWLYQPLWSGSRSASAVTVGAVLSILIGPKFDGAAVFPALSVQVPSKLAVVLLVSVVKFLTWSAEPAVRPLPPVLSAHVNVTRTSLFVHVSAV